MGPRLLGTQKIRCIISIQSPSLSVCLYTTNVYYIGNRLITSNLEDKKYGWQLWKTWCQKGWKMLTRYSSINHLFSMVFRKILVYNDIFMWFQALLSGCSAGGLASILHCDEFGSLFPKSTRVKCLADAGMFMDA